MSLSLYLLKENSDFTVSNDIISLLKYLDMCVCMCARLKVISALCIPEKKLILMPKRNYL